MADDASDILEALIGGDSLSVPEYEALLVGRTEALQARAAEAANELRLRYFGNKIYIRGLIEFTNYCRNDCMYCGIRRSNPNVERYRLTSEQIYECCEFGYGLGFRTFVLQGGEDGWFNDDRLVEIVREIKSRYPDCAVTLSVGERSRESYSRLRSAGADRYLLRHETANDWHYSQLHPTGQCLSTRLRCLKDLKELGFQTGCGFMVGSPYQALGHLAEDLTLIRSFCPAMVGLGPFIPHCDTPFRDLPCADIELTLFLLSLVRLTLPKVLLPATTALATLDPKGRIRGILSGANVVMPNLSPFDIRKKYLLYNNKAGTGTESAEGIRQLSEELGSIGCEIVVDRGDALR